MTDFFIQDRDVFAAADPGITFDRPDETWTISTGVLVSSTGDNGIFGELAFQSLINNGTVLSDSDDVAAVEMNGGTSLVANAVGARIIGADEGVRIDGDTAVVRNQGTILGLSNIGVEAGEDSDHVTVNNSGNIFGRGAGVADFSRVHGATIHNVGVISGDFAGIGVVTAEGVTTVISNAAGATIRGGEVAIFAMSGAISLTNFGRVDGGIASVTENNAKDVIVNHGKILGPVFLAGGNDVYNGTGGTAGIVFGDAGNDRLVGGAAADTFDGGFGNDTLIGHGGADRFEFDTGLSPANNVDTIGDFTAHIDKIVLDRGIFEGVGQSGALAAARFHVGAAAADSGDRIIYNANNGFLFYDADGKGGAGQIHFATLTPHLDLHNTDFLVALLAA